MAYETLKNVSMEDYAEEFLTPKRRTKTINNNSKKSYSEFQNNAFDEPDSTLDYPNKHMVLGVIKNIVGLDNKSGIITLHDPNLALSYCDNIIILNNGKIFNQLKVRK